jgi:hypothetical protein
MILKSGWAIKSTIYHFKTIFVVLYYCVIQILSLCLKYCVGLLYDLNVLIYCYADLCSMQCSFITILYVKETVVNDK